MTAPAEAPLSLRVIEAMRAAVPDSRPDGATVAGYGWDVVAWRVPAADGDWLLRVPRLPQSVPTIEAQHRLMDALAATGLPLPREPRVLRDASGVLLAGLYRYVDGAIAEVHGRGERLRLAAGIAEFLSVLHAQGAEAGIRCGGVATHLWTDLYGPLVGRSAEWLGATTAAWVRARGAALERASRHMPPPTLIHADLKPQHVLVDEQQRVLGVLDFEGVQVSDPAFDFARVIQNWDPAFARLVLARYRGPVDEGFMERAQCYRDLEALTVIDSAAERGWDAWLPWARRDLARRAGAATRRLNRAGL